MPLPFLAFLGLGAAGKLGYDLYDQARQEQQAKKYGQVFSDIIGTPGQELAGPRREGYEGPLMSPGTGLMGGQLTIPEAAGRMAQIPGYEPLAGAILRDRLDQKTTGPKTVTMGVPGKPKMRTNAIFSPQGELVPIGEPWEAGASTQINIGEGGRATPLTPAELKTYNAPKGSYWSAKGEIKHPPAAQAKETSQEERALGLIKQYEDKLFNPEYGIYSKDYGLSEETKALVPDWAEGLIEKGGQAAENFLNYWMPQNDPRIRDYEDFRKGTLSPLAKSLGEVGALAEGDVERAGSLQPQVIGLKPDTPETARRKISNLRTLISKGQENARLGITVVIQNGERWEYRTDPKTGKLMKRKAKPEEYGDE